MDKRADKKNDRKKERVGQSIKIKRYDDIFEGGSVPAGNAADGRTVSLSPSELRDFKDHPFKVEGKGTEELMESIGEHGILTPLIVRPLKGSGAGYEVISGHRRKFCALKLGLASVPVIIKDIDDDEAVLAMVDSNIQREDILPSEKAFAYKMKLEAIKRQGKRSDLTSGQLVRKLESVDIIGAENNESGRQIRRYIRLTELPPPMLGAVDSKKMSFNAGVELSYLTAGEKEAVVNAAAEMRRFPTLMQAKKIRELSLTGEGISEDKAIEILMEGREANSAEEKVAVNFEFSEIREFFPKHYTSKQIEREIIKLLKERG